MKINASALRAGNVVEIDSKLYAVLTAENIKPGKGTPVTQLELRRVSDGVKIQRAVPYHRAGRARLYRG